MQLILDAETTIGIERNMSTLNEESLVEKLDDVIQELKSDICNSNKENIHSQDNIITSDEKELNSDNDKGSISEISATKSPGPSDSTNTEIVNNENDNDATTEDSNPQILVEHAREIVDQQQHSEAALDTVEQQTSNAEMIQGIIDQQYSSKSNVDAIEHHASNEEILDKVDQLASSDVFEKTSNEKTLRVDGEQISSEDTQTVDVQQTINEKSLSINDQEASNEETLEYKQVTCKETLDADDQQAVSEKSIGVDYQQLSEETRDEDNTHASSEATQDITGIQHGSNKDTLGIVEQHASMPIDDKQASSETIEGVSDQENTSGETLDNEIEELEKDDDSDPITIAYEEKNCTEEKSKPEYQVQQVNSPSEESVQMVDDILITDNCAALKEVQVVKLDDEQKEHSNESALEMDKQKQMEDETECNKDMDVDEDCVDETKQNLETNKYETSITESDNDISSPKININTEEKDIVNINEPMEVDSNSGNDNVRVKEVTELICNDIKSTSTLDEEDIRKDTEDLSQTATMNSMSDSIVKDAEVKSVECENINEIEEKTECNKDMDVDEVTLVKEKCELSPQNNLDTLGKESKISNDTETQIHRNKLSDDLKNIPSVLKLSNTLNILSDDEDIEPPKDEHQSNTVDKSSEKQCINIEDDDDIMLIDEEDINNKDNKAELNPTQKEIVNNATKLDNQMIEKSLDDEAIKDDCRKDTKLEEITDKTQPQSDTTKFVVDESPAVKEEKPLVPNNFLKSYKKNLADMTREDLEEFCILKIVESIVDRSNLSDIKSKLKTMAQNIEEHKKKAMMLTKQNRDLQVVLKSVQEELKKSPGTAITPLKISRSVGMQVLMTEKANMRRKVMGVPTQAVNGNTASPNKSPRTQNPSPRPIKPAPPSQTIPVPRLVPASNNVVKNANTITQTNVNNSGKAASPLNGIKTTPIPKMAEKRPLSKPQGMTVDLTDDEPPAKVMPRSSPVAAPPVRLLHPLAQNSPRKVYIPISGPQGNIRPGQTIMLKTVPNQGPRPRGPMATPRLPQNQIRMPRIQNRHPAPLPEVKQYQTNHYKALPPAPDLKLSKVENGIVISWKIEGYQEDSYEEIASYQLYAYQESSSPPSTALWKKIGDVKALPLPMACTLTQFMAGFKYYFAVRAVDVRSRFGPFSLPGSILLLNKI